MGQQPNVDIEAQDRPRPVAAPAPARRWRAGRPGDLHRPADVPRGPGFGTPGPDSGYALKIVRDENIPVPEDERREHIEAALMHLMVARASRHGKAPSRSDLQFAAMVLGLASEDLVPATANIKLAAVRRYWAPRVAHSEAQARAMVGELSEESLGLDLDEVRHRLALGESLLGG